MTYKLPVRSLIHLGTVISFLFSLLLTIFLVSLNYKGLDSIYRFFQSLVFSCLACYGNILIFYWVLYVRKNISAWVLYLYSYIWVLFVWLFVVGLYTIVTGNNWEGERGSGIVAYFLAVLAVFCFNTVILIIYYLIIFQNRNSQNEIEKLQLKANISETTNLLLRQQIQPHFLFNALTTLKSLYKQDTKLGEEYLVSLANFLRVSVSNPKQHLALVKQEIAFCLNYLKMQKMRFGTALEYNIKLTETVLSSGYIPYFSLQPLVENALKHNESTEERPIRISIFEENGYIVIRNNLQENIFKEKSAGNGLYNLRERYRLLGEDDIRITSEGGFFTVYLKLLKG